MSQLYKRTEINQIWSVSNRPKTLSDLTCNKSHETLITLGTWIGNLSDNGECLGYAEAPEWTTGNYLNYLSVKTKQKNEMAN
jgi:hypothetical protein